MSPHKLHESTQKAGVSGAYDTSPSRRADNDVVDDVDGGRKEAHRDYDVPRIDSTIKRTGENSGSQERIERPLATLGIVDGCRRLGRLRLGSRRRRPRSGDGGWLVGLFDNILKRVR